MRRISQLLEEHRPNTSDKTDTRRGAWAKSHACKCATAREQATSLGFGIVIVLGTKMFIGIGENSFHKRLNVCQM